MKLANLKALRYRSLRDASIPIQDLNLFIGTNASGKSSILDALRFLQEGVSQRDFREAVAARGGLLHLAWKGEDARQVRLAAEFVNASRRFEWSVGLVKDGYGFSVQEEVNEVSETSPPIQLLSAQDGKGWWWSGERQRVQWELHPTACGLAAAAADATFPARGIAEFVGDWGFFDPNPFSLRRGIPGMEPTRLDPLGRNLAQRLFELRETSPGVFQRIVSATQSVLGLPTEIEPRESEGRFYFAQRETGLRHWVHQIGVSSGTLRVLALMIALFGEESHLVGIEEPENNVHPTAIAAFANYLCLAKERTQILVTTHSPILLDHVNDPRAVCVVRRSDEEGTRVVREMHPEGVRQALEASGFGLGEFYETAGFGG